ncbi:hypothetical protein TCAL_09998, partial [Tigriopus californicus]
GQAYQEGRSCGQVRDPLWSFPAKDRQEDGGLSARQVHMLLLWQGCHEAQGRGHLVLQHEKLSRDRGRRSLELHNHRRRLRSIRHPTSERNEGALDQLIHRFCISPFTFIKRWCV